MRSQLLALAVLVTSVLAIALIASAWSRPTGSKTGPAHGTQTGVPTGRPEPTVIATAGTLPIKLPIARPAVTAIGFYASPGTISLNPAGSQANEGIFARLYHRLTGAGRGGLSYYLISGGSGTENGALDVGAPAGADVYAPVTGTIIGIGGFVLSGHTHGVEIDIRPTDVPSDIVSLTQIEPDPSIAVGKAVVEGSSRLGSVIDLSQVERQALARYTQDQGNHVTIQVRQSATSGGP